MTTPTLPLAIIDVQPGHNTAFCSSYVANLVKEVRLRIEAGQPVYIVYNDEDMSGDTEASVQDFWMEHGLDESDLFSCTFIEKQFAELRGWMDFGVDEDEIVEVMKRMRANRLNDSRLLEPDVLEALSCDGKETKNPIFLSYFLESSPLRHVRDLDVCGGGRSECLREVELWMESLGTNYNRLEHLSYGG